MASIRRVLYATDFSTASRRAFATAVDMAKSHRAALMILHAFVPGVPPDPELYPDLTAWEQVDAQGRRWSQQELSKLADKAKKAGIRVTTLLAEGDPAQQIVRVARLKQADLLVIGTHGRRGLSKLLLGSVAERVISMARCPVVTVRGT